MKTVDRQKIADKVTASVPKDTPSQVRFMLNALALGKVSKFKMREGLEQGCRRSMADGVAKMIMENLIAFDTVHFRAGVGGQQV